MQNKTFLIVFTVGALALGGLFYLLYPTPNQYEAPEEVIRTQSCTKELHVCPDGSTVARDPKNNCEFTNCPPPAGGPPGTVMEDGTLPDESTNPPTESVFCTMEAKLCPDGSYVGRMGPKCEFAPCP